MKGVRMFRLVIALATALVGAFSLSAADEWYVDASKETGGDGTTPQKAYHTIKEALAKAQPDDIIYVAPGVYGTDEGATPAYSPGGGMTQYARVALIQRVKLVATGGRDVTFIVGGGDTTGLSAGVQCIFVPAAGQGSVIEGFTLCNGGGVNHKMIAGGISGTSTVTDASNFTLAYSTVSNCVGSTGAMRGGLAVGCLFVDNARIGSNAVSESCRDMDAFNCIIANHAGTGTAYYHGNHVAHCTIMNNAGRGYYVAEAGYFGKTMQNSVCAENGTVNNVNGIAVNSVIEAAWSNESQNVTISVPAEREGGVLVMAAPLGDFRPVAGGLLLSNGGAGRGLLAPDWVPAEYRNRDFYGKPIPAEATIPIGALILEAATPVTAATRVYADRGAISLDGHRVNATYVSYAKDKWPSQVYLTVNPDVVPHLFGYRNMIGTVVIVSPADRDGGYRFTLPRPDEGPSWNYLRKPDFVRYVDRENGDDSKDGSSWALAFASLAKACESTVADKRTLVYVKPGDYDNEVREGIITSGVKARVALANKCHASFRAVGPAGAAETFIMGAAHLGAAAAARGCGADAIQGVDVDDKTELLFSGFTFKDCYAHVSDALRAAGFNGGNALLQAAHDCVFDGCVSYLSPVAYKVHLNRCLFRNNYYFCTSQTGHMQKSIVQACVFESSNASASNSRGPFGADDVVYNTSGYLSGFTMNASSATLYNSVMCGGNGASNPDATKGYDEMRGMFLWRFATISAKSGFSTVNPRLVRPKADDFRPTEGSPVLTGGSFGAANFSLYTTSDFHNRPMFAAEGQATVPSGAIAVAKDARTFYVSPTGDDTADGLTEATARKTPAKAFELTEGGGDTVVALPGVYRTGSDLHTAVVVPGSPTPTIPSRVRVPDSVRFVSRDGAATTTIEGEEGVRGVFLEEDATIAGFTIAHAKVRVDGSDKDVSDDFSGGGVLGRGHDRAFVEDCVINCCTGISGCVAAYVTLNRCQCLSCDCVVNSANAVFRCSAFNSFFDDLGCNTGIRAFHEIINCTLGSRNGNAGSRSNNYAIRAPYNANSSRIINVLVLQKITAQPHVLGCEARNLVFPSNATFSDLPEGALETFDLTKTATQLQALYDGTTGRAQSLEAVGVDGGAATELAGAKDLAGAVRVQNGAIDVGCYEADWKGAYASSLGANVTVTAASAGVRSADGTLSVPAGEALALTWTPGKVTGAAVLTYALSEGASLTVTVNGVSRTVTDGTSVDLRDLLEGTGPQAISIAAADGAVTLGHFERKNGFFVLVL